MIDLWTLIKTDATEINTKCVTVNGKVHKNKAARSRPLLSQFCSIVDQCCAVRHEL
jgi:hypothetical protein